MFKTRKEAMTAGDKTYFTGVPCKNGHMSYRYTQSAGCSECINGHKISNNSDKSEKIAALLSTKAQHDAAMASFVIVKIALFPDDKEAFDAFAYAMAAMRNGDIEPLDVQVKAPNKSVGIDKLLYQYNCHPADVDALRMEQDRLHAANPRHLSKDAALRRHHSPELLRVKMAAPGPEAFEVMPGDPDHKG